jgi:hypothetical protein
LLFVDVNLGPGRASRIGALLFCEHNQYSEACLLKFVWFWSTAISHCDRDSSA